jgi:ATP-dependent RNA helicase RhlE
MPFSHCVTSPILLNQLNLMGFREPSKIQTQIIPLVKKGADVLASAPTGSGKTAAFGIPLIDLLECSKIKTIPNTCRALILAPTRELANQLFDVFKQLSQGTAINIQCVFGGIKINPQMMKLRKGCHILIATPGRLIDLMNKNAVSLRAVKTLILDEADKLIDLGFQDEINQILQAVPDKKQTLLFSATYTENVKNLCDDVLKSPKRVIVGKQNTASSTVSHWLHPLDKSRKIPALLEILNRNPWPQTIVFVKTKKGVNQVYSELNKYGITAELIHGDKSQQHRSESLLHFKSGASRVLVATDVASRGLDIENLPAVINFDLPKSPQDYVHRIGRTGRAGKTGVAVSLVCADEIDQLMTIETTIGKLIPRKILDGFEPTHNVPASVLKPRKALKTHKKKLAKQKAKQQSINNKSTLNDKKSSQKHCHKSSGRKAPSFIM